MNMNNVMNINAIETDEPDGDINWEEIDDELENNSPSLSDPNSEPEEVEYFYSNMYGTTPMTIDNELTDDPPASNTRRRRKTHK